MRARLAPLLALLLVACVPGGPAPAPSGTPYNLATATPDPTPTPTPVPSPMQARFAFGSFKATVDGQDAPIAPMALRSLAGDTEDVLIGVLPEGQLLAPGAYQLKLALQGETFEHDGAATRGRMGMIALLATVYALLMLLAGGSRYLLLSALLYAPGSILFFVWQRERGAPPLNRLEWAVCIALCLAALLALWGLLSGGLRI